MLFGISISPNWANQDEITRAVEMADVGGLDLVGIQDHPYQWRFYDTWTLISYLAGITSRVRFFPDVINLPLRPPAILAKSAASLDVLTSGRLELGLGAGGFWDAVVAMGGPRREPAAAFEAFEEALDVIRLVWSGDRGVRYDGRHYQLAGLHTGPQPAHDIQIWVGAGGPRMLSLIGRKGDGWVPSSGWAGDEELREGMARIGEAASEAGRDPVSISCVYNVAGTIDADGPGAGFDGPAGYWLERLDDLAALGVAAVVFWPKDDQLEQQVERFAEDVASPFRELSA